MAQSKKPAKEKTAAPKAAAKKATPAKKDAAPAKKAGAAIAARYTKAQIVTDLMESSQLSKKQVQGVLDGLGEIIERHLKKGGCGDFVMPGLFKITTVKKPATKARKGINPFTKQEVMFKAKPASTAVKVRALSGLKEMVK